MPRYLITLAIGPVQDFIAAARRTRDLWFGSQVLSEVSKAAAASLNQGSEDCSKLIFPAPKSIEDLENNSDFNVGNKLLAIIETNNPAGELEKAKQAAKDRWEAKAEQAKQRALSRGIHINQAIWNHQVIDVLEFFGAWVSFAENDSYTDKRKRLDQLLNARKNTREFIQNPVDGKNILKSSLDGLRENVIKKSDPWACRKAGLNNNESLDCTGVVKRLGDDPDQFTPISRIALNPWLKGLADTVDFTDIHNCLDALVSDGITSRVKHSIYAQLPYDGQLLYPFRLEAELDKLSQEADNASKQATTKLKALQKAIAAQNLKDKNSEASPYMAILAADGDRMGELLTQMQALEQHRNISSILTGFATEVPALVRGFQGHCIYAGGDDVLALVPLDQAINCSKALADAFYQTMSTVEGINTEAIPTLSVGLGISHFMTPMGKQLDLARKAEKLAKSNDLAKGDSKNALAIIIQPRSGAEISFRERWDQGADQRLKDWIQTHIQDILPRKAAYNLREESLALNWCDINQSEHQNLIAKETRRILEHKRTADNEQPEDRLINAICERATDKGLAEVANELILTRRIAQACQLAKPSPTNTDSQEDAKHA